MSKIVLSQAVEGYLLHASARRLSQNTILAYSNTFKQLQAHLQADPPFAQITHQQLDAFLAACPHSKKTALNHRTALAALWVWAVAEGLAPANIVAQVPRPRPEKTAIVPLSEKEVKAILEAITYTATYTRPGKKASRHKLKDGDRGRAIVLLLLDTGLRATELCDLRVRDCDMKNKRVHVLNGKGDKERYIPISDRTASAIWKYLTSRQQDPVISPLFITSEHNPLDRDQLQKMLRRAGERAEVQGVHPHRFRHTFAISYLRNGGDIYTLQMILGHSTLDMIRKYLALAQVDVDSAHRRASPVDNMRL